MKLPLTGLDGLRFNNVLGSTVEHRGKQALRIVLAPTAKTPDEPNFALIEGAPFADGAIELELASQILPNSEPQVRGFVGVAFRIADDCRRFECVYIRPTNARANDQLRRNRSIQYFGYPDFKFDRLRREAAGIYESYVDLELGAWTKLRIEVAGDKARIFVHDAPQPTLIVNDLKLGAGAKGAVGLFIDNGSEGFFRDLTITPR